MILYPPAKINLGLYVTAKRNDGFHDIETLFYSIGLTDILEFIPDKDLEDDFLTLSGLPVPGSTRGNLILKACSLYREKVDLPFFRIHLHKRIPMGAGLGGGSSNASYMLRGLNDFSQGTISTQEMKEMALLLGSDCPFFLHKHPMIGRGRGEKLEKFPLDISSYYLCIFYAGIHVSTAQAYQGIKVNQPFEPLPSILNRPVGEWDGILNNCFEESIFQDYPEIREMKENVYRNGAAYASMSGSGSAVFGLFSHKPELIPELKQILVWEGKA